jgi:hypothetical protein
MLQQQERILNLDILSKRLAKRLTTIVGGHKNGFSYANEMAITEYVVNLPQKVQRALEAIGWRPVAKNTPRIFQELFPAIKNLRPLQKASINLTIKLAALSYIVVLSTPVEVNQAKISQHQSSL